MNLVQKIVEYWTVTIGAKSTDELDAERYLIVVPTGPDTVMSLNRVAFSRWHLLLTSCLAMFTAGTIPAFSSLYDALDVHIYGAQTKSSVTVLYQAYIWMGLTAAISGPFIERRGPRTGMVVATIMLAIGFTLAQLAVTTKAPLFLILGYSVLCGGGFGIVIVSTMTASQKWFPDIRGLAAGLCMCSFGVGSFAGSHVYRAFLNRGGASSIPHVFWSTGLAIVVLTSAATLVIRTPPATFTVNGHDIHGVPESKAPDPALVHDEYLKIGMTLVNYSVVQGELDGTDVAYFQQVKALSLMQCIWSTDFFFMYLAFAASIIPAMVFSSEFVAITTQVLRQSAEVTNAAKMQGLAVNFSGQLVVPILSDLIIRVCYANPAFARKIVFFCLLSAQLGAMVALSSDRMTFESVRALAFTYVFGSGGSMALIQCFITDMFGVYHAGTMYGLVFTCWSLRAAIIGYGFADFQVTRESFQNQMQWMLAVVAIGWVALLLVRTSSMDRFYYGYKYSVCGKVVVQFAFWNNRLQKSQRDGSESPTILAPPRSPPATNDFVLWNGGDHVRNNSLERHQLQKANV